MLTLGWFSTGRGEGSRNLLRAAMDAIQQGRLDARILYVFTNRGPGEAEGSDRYQDMVRGYSLPLVGFSSREFRRQLGPDQEWRLAYDRQVMTRLDAYKPDLCVLAGYMLIVGPLMCRTYSMINLHPAAPGGPVGQWQDVIWELISTQAKEAGARMHLVTEVLDMGPVVTYVTFPLHTPDLAPMWDATKGKTVEELRAAHSDEHPLFKASRRKEAARELPLVVETLRAFASGALRIQDRRVVDAEGCVIAGLCLNDTVEAQLRPEDR